MAFLEQLTGFSGRLTIGEVMVDASVSEVHGLEAETTDHSVESGSDTTDNIRPRTSPVQIEGIITNTPIATAYPGQTIVNSISSIVKGSDPVKSAWETIKGYFSKSTLITISSSLEDYDNCVLVSFSVTRNAASGQSLRFTATAKQIRIVTTQEAAAIKLPQTATAAKDSTDGKPKGKQQTKTASTEKNQSMAAKLLDKGASFFK